MKIVDKNTNKDLFGTNSLFYDFDLASYIEVVERTWISFENLSADTGNNIWRAGGVDPRNVNKLKESMSEDIIMSECLPVVELTDGLTACKYSLVDGFNRVHALMLLGYTGYFFDVVKFKGDKNCNVNMVRAKFALRSNCPRPKADSSDTDIINGVSQLIAQGDLPADKDIVRDWIRTNSKLNLNRASRLANDALSKIGSNQGVIIYDNAMINTIIRKDFSLFGIKSHGDWDATRGECGFTSRNDYAHETFISILKKLKTGKLSYVTVHCKLPKDNRDIVECRGDVAETFALYEDLIDHYIEWKKQNPGKLPYRIIGALPQTADEIKSGKKIVPIK